MARSVVALLLLGVVSAVRVYVVSKCDGCEAKGHDYRLDAETMRIAGFVEAGGGGNHSCARRDCEFRRGRFPKSAEEVRDVDVIVVNQAMIQRYCARQSFQPLLATFAALPRRIVKVLYWREAGYSFPSSCAADDIAAMFDLEMGVHFWAAIVNPSFFPRTDKADYYSRGDAGSLANRSRMVVHVSSHCRAFPRTRYVAELEKHVSVDKYGGCYRQKLPREHNDDVFAQYKFILAFENRIQSGYVTEKLLVNPLTTGLVPIYLGAPDVRQLPSIYGTEREWFINAVDFDTPAQLAGYLHHVASNETLYASYVQHFKTLVEPALVAGRHPRLFPNAPSPIARAVNATDACSLLAVEEKDCLGQGNIFMRRAAVCELCDLDSLAQRTTGVRAPRQFSEKELTDCLFLDTHRSCSRSLLDDDDVDHDADDRNNTKETTSSRRLW